MVRRTFICFADVTQLPGQLLEKALERASPESDEILSRLHTRNRIMQQMLSDEADRLLAFHGPERHAELAKFTAEGDSDAVQKLLLARANASAVVHGVPLLVTAVRNGHVAATELLLAAGAHVLTPSEDGSTAFHAAARFCDSEVSIALIKALLPSLRRLDTLVMTRDSKGFLPWHCAVFAGDLAVVQFLYEEFPDVIEAATSDGSTGLHLAALAGNKDMFDLLITHGLDPTVLNANGCTAVDLEPGFAETGTKQFVYDHVYKHEGVVPAFKKPIKSSAMQTEPSGISTGTQTERPMSASSDNSRPGTAQSTNSRPFSGSLGSRQGRSVAASGSRPTTKESTREGSRGTYSTPNVPPLNVPTQEHDNKFDRDRASGDTFRTASASSQSDTARSEREKIILEDYKNTIKTVSPYERLLRFRLKLSSSESVNVGTATTGRLRVEGGDVVSESVVVPESS
mmetsp:Transcript_50933/g.110680  ORF Transcript_50933/g.110680 Transcript_50933/m.110680 type:complete len:457 (-) Transcript_50933:114-1484(-)